MKVLLQRVSRAAVRVEGLTLSEIGLGLVAFVGVERGDDDRDADYFADKLAGFRIFPDGEGKMNLSVEEVSGAVLVVSQFTLAAATRRGRRPSYSRAAEPAEGRRLYERLILRLRERGLGVGTGMFQAMMAVELVNEGPVTILLDPPPFREGP